MPKLTRAEFKKRTEELRALIHAAPAFEDDTPAKRKKRVERAANDINYFGATYFPHYVEDATPEFHREWWSLANLRNTLVAIAAPRGHAKSARFALFHVLHWICFAARKLIVIGSNTGFQAEVLTTFIKLELEENERLRADFGELARGRTWADGEFVTQNGVMVVARGKGEALRGLRNRAARPDAFVGDDLETDEEVVNPRRVEKTLRWLKGVVIPALSPKGFSLTVVGNLLGKKSALARLMNEKRPDGAPLHTTRLYRAVDAEGNPLWAARFTREYLAEIRAMAGEYVWCKEYLNDPADPDAAFREEWLVEWPDDAPAAAPVSQIVIYTDPSQTDSEKSDYKATVALGRSGRYADVLGARIRRESVGAMLDGVFALYTRLSARHPAARIVIAFEENSFALLAEAYEAEAEKRDLRPRLARVKNTGSKLARILSLSHPVEPGALRFKRADTDQPLLIEQLLATGSTSANDDGPDALEGAYQLLEKPRSSRAAAGRYEGGARRNAARLTALASRRHDKEAA